MVKTNKYERDYYNTRGLNFPGRHNMEVYQNIPDAGDGYPGQQWMDLHLLTSIFQKFIIEGCSFSDAAPGILSAGYIMVEGEIVEVSEQTGITIPDGEFLYIDDSGVAQTTATESTAMQGIIVRYRSGSTYYNLTLSHVDNLFKNFHLYVEQISPLIDNIEIDSDILLSGEIQFPSASVHSSGTQIHIHPNTGNADGNLILHPVGTNTASIFYLRNSVTTNYGDFIIKVSGGTASLESAVGGSGTKPTTLNINQADWDAINIGDASAVIKMNNVTITATQFGYVGTMNQGVATSNTPSFTGLTLTSNLALGANSITGTSVDINNAELQQLSNIGANVIGGTQWGYVANMQSVSTSATPSFARLTLTQGTGTAPMTISSTTVVTNLNADLWDGYQFADYLDQAVKQASTPTFGGLTLNGTLAMGSNAITTDSTVDGVDVGTLNSTVSSHVSGDVITSTSTLAQYGDKIFQRPLFINGDGGFVRNTYWWEVAHSDADAAVYAVFRVNYSTLYGYVHIIHMSDTSSRTSSGDVNVTKLAAGETWSETESSGANLVNTTANVIYDTSVATTLWTAGDLIFIKWKKSYNDGTGNLRILGIYITTGD
jgi:hypothetical protein